MSTIMKSLLLVVSVVEVVVDVIVVVVVDVIVVVVVDVIVVVVVDVIVVVAKIKSLTYLEFDRISFTCHRSSGCYCCT